MNQNVKAVLLGVGIVVVVTVITVAVAYRAEDRDADPSGAEVSTASGPSPVTPSYDAASPWFVVDITNTECFTPTGMDKASPAAWIKAERENGESPEIKESRGTDGSLESVEITVPVGDGLRLRVWTYYRTKELCEQALQHRNQIPDEYR